MGSPLVVTRYVISSTKRFVEQYEDLNENYIWMEHPIILGRVEFESFDKDTAREVAMSLRSKGIPFTCNFPVNNPTIRN